jgi:hypothetical protein
MRVFPEFKGGLDAWGCACDPKGFFMIAAPPELAVIKGTAS